MIESFYSRNIKYLLKVAELKSITKAANQLYVSQSTVSLSIKQLEEELGFELFIRKKGKSQLTLTDQAEKIIELLKDQQKSIKDLNSRLKTIPNEPLKIATVPYFSDKFLMPAIYRLNFENQCNVFHLRGGRAKEAVLNANVDISFFSSPSRPIQSKILCHKIRDEKFGVIGLKKNFKDLEEVKTIEDLKKFPWIEGSHPREDWYEALNGETGKFWVDDHYSAKQLLINGFGVSSFQFDYFTDEELKRFSVAKKLKLPARKYSLFAVIANNLPEYKMKMCQNLINVLK